MGLFGRTEEEKRELSASNNYQSIKTNTEEIRNFEETTVKNVLGKIVINGNSFGADIYDVEYDKKGYSISFNSNDFEKAANAINYDIESLIDLLRQIDIKIEQNKITISEDEVLLNDLIIPDYADSDTVNAINARRQSLTNEIESLRQDILILEDDKLDLEKEIEDKKLVLNEIKNTIDVYNNTFGTIDNIFGSNEDKPGYTTDGNWKKEGDIFVVADKITGETHLCIRITDKKHNAQYDVGLDEGFDFHSSRFKTKHYKSFKEVFGTDAVKEVIYPVEKEYDKPDYDTATKMQNKEYFDQDGNVIKRLVRIYDEKGDIITTTVYDTDNPIAGNSITYNGNNQKIGSTTYICGNNTDSQGNPLPIQETKIKYDPNNGAPIEKELYDKTRPEMGRIYLIEYENDASGNPISSSLYTGQGNNRTLDTYTTYNSDGTYKEIKYTGGQKDYEILRTADGKVLTTTKYGD